jgi:D-alanine-D-alanine ligase
MDKAIFHDVMRANNIPRSRDDGGITEGDRVLDRQRYYPGRAMARYPLFTKPSNLGHRWDRQCRNRSDLIEGLVDAAPLRPAHPDERRECLAILSVSVLGNDDPIASVPGRFCPSREFYSYEAKYLDNASGLADPGADPIRTDPAGTEIAVKAYKAVDCAGMARADSY